MTEPAIIEVNGLEKAYGGRTAVGGLTFSIPRGEIFGLLGPNGAGKSTVIECLVGLREPDSGSIRVLGMRPGDDRRAFSERVAIQPQAASLFESLTVDETLSLFRSFYENGRDPRSVRNEVGLKEQHRTRVKHLSGGQLRRLLLGVALVGAPQVVVLDEPSAGLDPAARQQLWRTIRGLASAGTTVLLSTHHMDEATSLCDRVGILVEGQFVALDTPENLIIARDAATTVSFSTSQDVDLAAVRQLKAITELVVEEHGTRVRVRVQTSKPDEVIRKLTFMPGLQAREFDIKRSTLEDLFIELSGIE